MILYLRRARKICQLRINEAAKMTGLDISLISQCEHTNERIDTETATALWDLYGRVPHPPSRFEGKLQTVAELKAAYYAENEAVTE